MPFLTVIASPFATAQGDKGASWCPFLFVIAGLFIVIASGAKQSRKSKTQKSKGKMTEQK